jgi:hypothetical protein
MLDPKQCSTDATPEGNVGGEGHSRYGLDSGRGDDAVYRLRLQLWDR